MRIYYKDYTAWILLWGSNEKNRDYYGDRREEFQGSYNLIRDSTGPGRYLGGVPLAYETWVYDRNGLHKSGIVYALVRMEKLNALTLIS